MLHHPAGEDDHSSVMPKTRWAETIDGAGIAYQDFGEGPVTLLVIHGWISHLEVYWEQPRFARFMRRLSRNMRVLHFDKRGVGMSDRFGRPPDLETRMDDVRAVMDAAGVERTALFGWGTGGPRSLRSSRRRIRSERSQYAWMATFLSDGTQTIHGGGTKTNSSVFHKA
jgi:pimeloyl-ACP methyl ester carboxylesterase